jgi:hypothetical protein
MGRSAGHCKIYTLPLGVLTTGPNLPAAMYSPEIATCFPMCLVQTVLGSSSLTIPASATDIAYSKMIADRRREMARIYLARNKISDREPGKAVYAAKAWMANNQNVSRSLVRHRTDSPW